MLAALEVNRTLGGVSVSYRFLRGLSECDQRRFFRALDNIPTLQALRIEDLPGEDGGIPIRRRVLLESLSLLVTGLHALLIHGIVLSDQSEVELLTDAVGAGVSLRILSVNIFCSKSNANSPGFLDPILHAARKLPQLPPLFALTDSRYRGKETGSSLITVQALRLFL